MKNAQKRVEDCAKEPALKVAGDCKRVRRLHSEECAEDCKRVRRLHSEDCAKEAALRVAGDGNEESIIIPYLAPQSNRRDVQSKRPQIAPHRRHHHKCVLIAIITTRSAKSFRTLQNTQESLLDERHERTWPKPQPSKNLR